MMFTAALIQTRTGTDPERNFAALARQIREAAAAGAGLVVTPEGSNVLQRDRALLAAVLREEGDDLFVSGLARLARELSITLVAGSLLVRAGDQAVGKAANRCYVFAPDGSIAARYDKVHLFDVNLGPGGEHRESDSYVAGARACCVATPAGVLGLTICYDVRFPHLYRDLARAGAQIITTPAAFTRVTGEAHWETLLRARAIETGAFILAPAQGGLHEDGRATWGRSVAYGPWGERLGLLDHDEPGTLLVNIDLAAAQEARRRIPALRHDRVYAAP